MKEHRFRDNDAIYYDILSLERTGVSSIKVAASMTTSIIQNLLSEIEKENPHASKKEILVLIREIMDL